MFKGKSILITGGTGSFGKKFSSSLLNKFKNIKRLVIFSRDELKQFEMSNSEPFKSYKDKVRFFLGDVRDINRLKRALHGIDIVIHAAALKQVPAAEYNPMEFINTNIIGAQNVIEAAIDRNIKNVVALSTDKATSPINLYGASKLASEAYIRAFSSLYNIQAWILRLSNMVGERTTHGILFDFLAKENNYLDYETYI